MCGKTMFRLLALGVLMSCVGQGRAAAAPPWASLGLNDQVEANENKSYAVAEENGPWMIMACSFSGEGAEKQAKELVLELRKRYKLEAYVHQAKFEVGKIEGRGFDKYGRPKKMRAYNNKSENTEIAVMVGNFPSANDPEAQKVLKKIKSASPKCLDVKENQSTHLSFADFKLKMPGANKAPGPMSFAFMTTNPVLPSEYFAPKTLDPLIVDMNKNAEFSLLECPGKYTVKVATFRGQSVIDQREIKKIEEGKEKLESSLTQAALKAHELAKALRLKGYDAYEFHDRCESVVTVGSFRSLGAQTPDGGIDPDPNIKRIIKTFEAKQKIAAGQPMPVERESLVGIFFDIQPIVMEVPKQSISASLNRPRME
jgi:hypothetical protein